MPTNLRDFEKGLAGGDWRPTVPTMQQKMLPQNCVLLLIRGHGRKGAEKRPQFMVWEGFPCANPLCPPTPFETSDYYPVWALGNYARPMRLPDPSPVLDKNHAPMGPEILSSTRDGVWRKAPMTFPDSSSVLDKFQSANQVHCEVCKTRHPHASSSHFKKNKTRSGAAVITST